MALARGLFAALVCLLASTVSASPRPLVSVMGTCSDLVSNTYPADSMAWFNAGRQRQVIFYAHLLFPVRPEGGLEGAEPLPGPWHPPMAVVQPSAAPASVADAHYVEAEWLDPEGARVAFHGMTLAARIRSDWLTVNGRDYIPHTFAMAIGTREIRADGGQLRLPSLVGQYTVRFKVDGESQGLAFFRMLQTAPPATASPPTVPVPSAPVAPKLSPPAQAR
jgi:hypothetical protein